MALFECKKIAGATGQKADLLWTNPNPTATFSAQTVEVDVDTYDYFLIDYKVEASDYNDMITFYIDNSGTYADAFTKGVYMGAYKQNAAYTRRKVSVDKTSATKGIVFSNCNSSSGSTANNYGIPYKIYGLKNPLFTENQSDLLWTNPNPTSDFSAKTVPLDTDTYKFFVVKFKYYKTQGNDTYIAIMDSDVLNFANSNHIMITGIHTNTYNVYRPFTINRVGISSTTSYQGKGIYFGDGKTFASSSSTYNGGIIPIEIYGYKNKLYHT